MRVRRASPRDGSDETRETCGRCWCYDVVLPLPRGSIFSFYSQRIYPFDTRHYYSHAPTYFFPVEIGFHRSDGEESHHLVGCLFLYDYWGRIEPKNISSLELTVCEVELMKSVAIHPLVARPCCIIVTHGGRFSA